MGTEKRHVVTFLSIPKTTRRSAMPWPQSFQDLSLTCVSYKAASDSRRVEIRPYTGHICRPSCGLMSRHTALARAYPRSFAQTSKVLRRIGPGIALRLGSL